MADAKNFQPQTRQITRIHVCGLNHVDETLASAGATHLITLINRDSMIETPAAIKPDDHLRLAMNDISQPQSNLTPPAQEHIEELLTFVSRWEQKAPMLIHCWAGISRSTAATYIALCSLNPDIAEQDIANAMREASSTAYPNRLMVKLGDVLLERNGRMIAAIENIGRGELVAEGNAFSLPTRFTTG